MSTTSTIGYYDGKTVKFIYCHWDGYLSHNGKILLEHYTDVEKIKELVSLGAISTLRSRVKPNYDEFHSFDASLGDVVVAYGRDRGEKIVIMSEPSSDLQKALKNAKNQQYAYVFDIETDAWYYRNSSSCGLLTIENIKE